MSDENPFFAEVRPLSPERDLHWENSFKIDILAYDDGLATDDFVDWFAQVEETLEFKVVPEDRRVVLVIIRLRGRAQA